MMSIEGQDEPTTDTEDGVRHSSSAAITLTPDAPERESDPRAQLQQSEQRFRALVEVVGQIIWITDAQGWTIEVTPAWYAFTGQPQGQGTGWGWIECVHPDDREPLIQAWSQARATRNAWEHELRLRRYDGIYPVFLARAVPILSDEGVREWICCWTDCGARNQLLRVREEARTHALALQEAGERMDEFLNAASHELKTPLTSLLGTIQMLERRFADLWQVNELARDYAGFVDGAFMLLKRLRRGGDRLNRLTSDLVDVSRIQAGGIEMRLAVCDLAEVVQEVVDEQWEMHPTRVIRQMPITTPVLVLADPDRIAQVATNYLTNALKYAPVDRPIEVWLEVVGNTVRVCVRDQGPGLPPDELDRVWNRWYQVPGIGHQSGSHIGLGMGLYISKSIVERHQGQVGVESVPGNGSIFWFTLPLLNSSA